jgi:hypothetical protein
LFDSGIKARFDMEEEYQDFKEWLFELYCKDSILSYPAHVRHLICLCSASVEKSSVSVENHGN